MKKEFRTALNKLKDAKIELLKKASFLNQHGFMKEQDHVLNQIDVVNEILLPLEMLIDGHIKSSEVSFKFK